MGSTLAQECARMFMVGFPGQAPDDALRGLIREGVFGAILFKLMRDYLADLTPQYWQFWIGLVLVVLVLVGRDRLTNWSAPLRGLLSRWGPRGEQARGEQAGRAGPGDHAAEAPAVADMRVSPADEH